MKTERRHELQHNQLADWLTETREKIEPYSTTIWASIGGLVIVAVLASYLVRQSSANKADQWNLYFQGNDSLAMGDSTALADMVELMPDSNAGHWARLQLGDYYMMQGVDNAFQDRVQSGADLAKAVEEYKYLLEHAEVPELLERATLGLARAYESQDKLVDAQKEYEAVVKNWPDSVSATEAKQRLADLERAATTEFYAWFATQDPKPPADPSSMMPGQSIPFDPTSLPSDESGSFLPFETQGDPSGKPADDSSVFPGGLTVQGSETTSDTTAAANDAASTTEDAAEATTSETTEAANPAAEVPALNPPAETPPEAGEAAATEEPSAAEPADKP